MIVIKKLRTIAAFLFSKAYLASFYILLAVAW